jgi:hypothetical protein
VVSVYLLLEEISEEKSLAIHKQLRQSISASYTTVGLQLPLCYRSMYFIYLFIYLSFILVGITD